MNMHNKPATELLLDLPREVDTEIAGDIEKESVFVSPFIERIRVEPDMKSRMPRRKHRRSR